MTVYIDDRAGSRDLVEYTPLDRLGELTRLDSADAQFVGNGPDDTPALVGVEVKSISDLLSSADTGRLQATQLHRMRECYDQPWVCFYGAYRCGMNGELRIAHGKLWRQHYVGKRAVPYGYIEGLLVEMQVQGVRVKHCEDVAEVAQWIGVLYRWWQKRWTEHKAMRTFDNSRDIALAPGMDDGVHYRARLASRLLPTRGGRGGVGFERAVAAAQHFGSVAAMVAATEQEWAKVPGIGKVLARAIVRAVQ